MSKNEMIDIQAAMMEAFVANAGQKGVTAEMKAKLEALSKALEAVRLQVLIDDMN